MDLRERRQECGHGLEHDLIALAGKQVRHGTQHLGLRRDAQLVAHTLRVHLSRHSVEVQTTIEHPHSLRVDTAGNQ